MSRFSTTYATSYRPYDDNSRRIHIPIKCTTSDSSVSSLLNVASQTISSSLIPVTKQQTSGGANHVSTSFGGRNCPTGPTLSPGDGLVGVIGQSLSNNRNANTVNQSDSFDRPRKMWEESTKQNLTHSYDIPLKFSSLASNAFTGDNLQFNKFGNSNKKDYTSTFTALVTDKLIPFSPIITGDNKCNKGTQASYQSTSTHNPSKARTLSSSVLSSTNPIPTDNFDRCGGLTKLLSISPTTNYVSSCQFGFEQMLTQIARINDHLYLSGLSALTPEKLRQYGITLLISAMIDSPPVHLRNAVMNTLHVPVEDTEGANLRAHFDRVADRVAAENRHGGRALIHCMAGVSRSSSLILAYLVRHMNMSLADAYQHVRSIRPCIQPNPGFWRQLLDYEERIRGNRSIRLLPSLNYGGSSNLHTAFRFSSSSRSPVRTNISDIFSRTTTSDLINYRPLTSLHTLDTGKPFTGFRQPLN